MGQIILIYSDFEHLNKFMINIAFRDKTCTYFCICLVHFESENGSSPLKIYVFLLTSSFEISLNSFLGGYCIFGIDFMRFLSVKSFDLIASQ